MAPASNQAPNPASPQLGQDDPSARTMAGRTASPQTGEGATEMPRPEQAKPALFAAEQVFDVCHVGVVLRAVLGVQGVLALGLSLASQGWGAWLQALSVGTVATLSGLLLWLLLVCAAKRLLARLPVMAQGALLLALGSGCALFGWQLLNLVRQEPSSGFRWFSVGMAGALSAAVLLAWLRHRERAQRPADAMAQLVELQSRIRPHFLFNTLNSAIALVRLDPQRAEGLLEDLSELFRAALAESGAVVSLNEEIELAQRYLAIEQIRFGERLRIRWEIDPLAGAARVPPLLLQPLVENAVRHGVEPNDEGGELLIRTRRAGAEVVLQVINSVGLPSRTRGHGLALRNVRQRLRLMHDVAAKFELIQEAGRFEVRMVLPR